MKVITGPRCSGKTTEAVQYCKKHDCVLVVHSQEAKKEAQLYGNIDILTYHDIMNGKHRGKQKPLFIDNMDMFVTWAVEHAVDGFTVNV